MGDLKNEEYIDLVRKCATIISKPDRGLEIMDSITFKTIKAAVDESLFNEANINDQVTYVLSDDGAKVLEVRKR
ncbi:hypothetical protein GOV06_04985 [Candidatus Woesearchaeota archaeon]|nr:hypothetical protein [Candidatus Woesearchaeota archaeon]